MNLLLLFVIAPLVVLLQFDFLQLVRRYNNMDEDDQKICWGGFGSRGKLFWGLFCVTYVQSYVGICSIFYLHLFAPPSWVPVFLFVALNVSSLVRHVALLTHNTNTMWVCIVVHLWTGIFILGYTLYLFPLYQLWWVYVCQSIFLVHIFVYDYCIWHVGWLQLLAHRKDMDTIAASAPFI
jgi:hypothetical protein